MRAKSRRCFGDNEFLAQEAPLRPYRKPTACGHRRSQQHARSLKPKAKRHRFRRSLSSTKMIWIGWTSCSRFTRTREANSRLTRSIKTTTRYDSSTSSEPSQASRDRKSTRLNSSHVKISYAVFCLKKKKEQTSLIYLCQKNKPANE